MLQKQYLSAFIVIIAFSFLSFNAIGQENNIGTHFWRIVTPDKSDTSYILGTNHICMDSYLNQNKGILKYFDASDVFAAEIVDQVNLSDQVKFDVHSLQWSRLASHAQRKHIITFFENAFHYPKKIITQHSITFLRNDMTYYFGYLLSEQISGIKGHYFVDDYLTFLCRNNKKEMVGLESAAQHYEFLKLAFTKGEIQSARSIKADIVALDSLIDIYNTNRSALLKDYNAIVLEYYNNDCCYNFSDSSQIPLENILLKQRNIQWLPNIEKLVNSKRAFIAVGLNHLRYKYGLVQLLKEKGYIVEPILETN